MKRYVTILTAAILLAALSPTGAAQADPSDYGIESATASISTVQAGL